MIIDTPNRLARRLVQHHLPLMVVLTVGILWLYRELPQKDVIWKVSFVTAYPALFLLVATLLIGPWNVVRKQRMPISSDLRRDIGIWAGIVGLAHTIIGLDVHMRGRPWLYFVYPSPDRHRVPLRHDLFGFANETGLLGTFILVLLLATSNDYFLRALGTPRWKQLQRWNYMLFAVVILHTFGYQAIEKQRTPFVAVVIVCVVLTLVLQGLGYRRRRSQLRQRTTIRQTTIKYV